MKRTIYFLVTLLLFQNCKAYKVIDLKTYNLDKPKKVKIILKNSKRYDGKIIAFNEDEVTLQNFKRKKIISIADIDKIKQPEFSIAKTLGLTFGILIVSGIILFVAVVVKLQGNL